MTSSPSHVLIIGAGLAGPALALALARNRIRSTIFERRDSPQDIGGVLMLAPNAVCVLDKILGIEAEIRTLGYTFSTIEMHADASASTMDKLGGITIAEKNSEDRCKGLTIKRPVLHHKLLDLCADEELIDLRYGKRLSEIEEDNEGVTAHFEDGSIAKGDILLGVDGIYSTVRKHVLRKEDPSSYAQKYCGHVVIGTTIRRSTLNLDAIGMSPPAFLLTQAGTILTFPTDPTGDTLQWAAFLNQPERDRKAWDQYRSSGQALKDLREEWSTVTSEPIKSLLDSIDTPSMMLWAPYAIPELPTWHTDRVCLLGDACHAISPSAGQGTAQALEDVGLMARLLSSQAAINKGYPALFEHYERVRKARMEGIKKFSERSIATRAPTPSSWAFWAKKLGYRALFGLGGQLGRFWRNPATSYDVSQESIVIP